MGLLEKAQERKQTNNQDITNEDIKLQEREIPNEAILNEQKEIQDKSDQDQTSEEKQKKNSHLFKKNELDNKNKSSKIKKEKLNSFVNKDDKVLYFYYKRQKIIEEKKGFGYKNLSTRRIVYNYDVNDFEYQISEPVLNKYERKVKKELSYLFKMLADVNISTMDRDEKKSYLENTLEQIIIDNDIKFYKKEKNKKSKSLKELFNFKKENKKEKFKDNKNSKHSKIFEKKNKNLDEKQDDNFITDVKIQKDIDQKSEKSSKIQLVNLKERGKS